MTLSDIRQQIDALDAQILKLLAKRFECCEQVLQHKEQVLDENREAEVQALWKQQAEELGLSEEFALALLEKILTESKRIQSE